MDSLRNENCKRCDLRHSAEVRCIMTERQARTEIMVITDAPTNLDEVADKLMSGRDGKILDAILEECGLKLEDVYITSIVKCKTPFIGGKKKDPVIEQMRACSKYLKREILRVKPKVIITLGSVAIKGLLDDPTVSISKERGKIRDWNGIKLLPTYHPAAAMKNKYYANLILEDIKNGLSREKAPELGTKAILVTKLNRDRIVGKLEQASVLSVDIETTNLDYMDPKEELLCVGISHKPGVGYTFPATGNNLAIISRLLDGCDLLVNHNIKFDLEWLSRYGIRPRTPLFDTMVAKHLLDENCPDKSLKTLARVELGMHQLSEESEHIIALRKKGVLPTLQEWAEYNGRDVDAAIRLYHKYSKELKEQGLDTLMRTEMRVLQTLVDMELFGFKIDLKTHRELSKKYEQDIHKHEVRLKRMLGNINLSSPKQLTAKLFDDMKLPMLVTTNKGKPSANEAALKSILGADKVSKENKEVIQALLDYRRVEKLYSVYLEGLKKNGLIKSDGKIHCNYKITGTVTGRLSCSDPNLQNIPRQGDIKSMFISSFPDGRIIQVDYSQMELRILAHYSGDKKLIEAFKSGRDIHQEVAAKVFNKPYDKVTEEERKFAKKVNFGVVYLISPAGLADKLVDVGRFNKANNKMRKVKFAKKLMGGWFEEFSTVKEWMRERREMIIETGKSPSINGRLRRLYGVSPTTSEGREAIRQGTNSPIQGAAGDITKYSMDRLNRRLKKEGLKARVNANVHDAVMVDSPKSEVKRCIALIKEIFIKPPVPLRVPIAFEIKVGKTWNELSVVNQ